MQINMNKKLFKLVWEMTEVIEDILSQMRSTFFKLMSTTSEFIYILKRYLRGLRPLTGIRFFATFREFSLSILHANASPVSFFFFVYTYLTYRTFLPGAVAPRCI